MAIRWQLVGSGDHLTVWEQVLPRGGTKRKLSHKIQLATTTVKKKCNWVKMTKIGIFKEVLHFLVTFIDVLWILDRSQSLFWFVPQEKNITVKLTRLVDRELTIFSLQFPYRRVPAVGNIPDRQARFSDTI